MPSQNTKSSIAVKALGLPQRDGKILAFEVLDQSGNIKGVRPLGGAIEFGETWRSALVREFKEELGADIRISGAPIVLENHFEDDGARGHEVLFIADVAFVEDCFGVMDVIQFTESDGTVFTARWFDLAELKAEGPELFPKGLLEHLTERR